MKHCRKVMPALVLIVGWTLSTSVFAQQSEQAPSAAPESEHGDDTAGKSATELAKETQNPVADLISVPFQNNTNFNYGPLKGTQNILNLEPVIPIHLNENWNIITRTIMPFTWQPALAPNVGSAFGLGNTALSLFLSPEKIGDGIFWGIGPEIVLPVTNGRVGSNIWGAALRAS